MTKLGVSHEATSFREFDQLDERGSAVMFTVHGVSEKSSRAVGDLFTCSLLLIASTVSLVFAGRTCNNFFRKEILGWALIHLA